MKINRVFIAVFIVVLAIIIFAQLKWAPYNTLTPTFNSYDENPFGSKLVDLILDASVKQGYTVTPKTLKEIASSGEWKDNSLLLAELGEGDYALKTERDSILLDLVKKGATVLFATENVSQIMYDKVGVSLKSTSKYRDNKRIINQSPTKDILLWNEYRGNEEKPKMFTVNDEFLIQSIDIESFNKKCKLLLYSDSDSSYGDNENPQREWYAIKFKYGDGTIVFVSAPLLFTNYAILHDDNGHLLMHLLAELDNKTIMRLDNTSVKKSQSFLSYVIENKPLRVALYTLLAAVIIYMLFTARRRQRIIPVSKPVENITLNLVKHLGSMYCHHHDNRDLLEKKYDYFKQDMRLCGMAELNDYDNRDDAIKRISSLSSLSVEEVDSTISEVEDAVYSEKKLSDSRLMQLIDKLNEISTKII